MGDHLRVPGYVVCQCELSHSKLKSLTGYCLDMRSTQFTRANTDSVPSLASSASGCATGTICMAYTMARITFAGTLTDIFIFPLLRH
jgi:hypothetical protein